MVRANVHAALEALKGLRLWISVLVRYIHHAKEVQDIHHQFLDTGKRGLMNLEELQNRLDATVGRILLTNAQFVRQTGSGWFWLVDRGWFRQTPFPSATKYLSSRHWPGGNTSSSPPSYPRRKRLATSESLTTGASGMRSPLHSPLHSGPWRLMSTQQSITSSSSSRSTGLIPSTIQSRSTTSPSSKTC